MNVGDPLTPEQRIFGSLRNMRALVSDGADLNAEREALLRSLDRALSWEGEFSSPSSFPHKTALGYPQSTRIIFSRWRF